MVAAAAAAAAGEVAAEEAEGGRRHLAAARPCCRPPALDTWKVEAFGAGRIRCAGRPAGPAERRENPRGGLAAQPAGGTGSDLGQRQLFGLEVPSYAFGTLIPPPARTSPLPTRAPHRGVVAAGPEVAEIKWEGVWGAPTTAPAPLNKGEKPSPSRGTCVARRRQNSTPTTAAPSPSP